MVSSLPAGSGFTRYQIDCKYDHMSRRIEKKVTNLDGGTGLPHRRYVYEGWNLIAELDGTGAALVRSYAWGADQSGSLSATGGAGALLRITNYTTGVPTTSYHPACDGNGNVTALVNAGSGVLAAVYEYDPYGNQVRNEVIDPAVADNPFRHSTKYTDAESGLVYYGYRYYDPRNGRFVGRDPIGEQGGVNLYGFVANDPINRVDLLGLIWDEIVVLPPVRSKGGGLPDPWSTTIRNPKGGLTVFRDVDDLGRASRRVVELIDQNIQKAIAPNKTQDPKCPELIAQAGKITGRMNETLSDQNVVEGNIRFGEAVSVGHMVISEGVELGSVFGKGFGVLKNVFTLGGHITRGSGTLGVGGRVVQGMPGTAAGDLINGSIGRQQWFTFGGAAFEETASYVLGVGVIKGTGNLVDEFRDAAGSGRGAVDAAYSASAALQRSYYQDAERLKAVRGEIKERGCGGN